MKAQRGGVTVAPCDRDSGQTTRRRVVNNETMNSIGLLHEIVIAGTALFFPLAVFVAFFGA